VKVAGELISHLAKPLKDSTIVVALLTCPRTTGSDMQRSSTMVETTRPSSRNAR